MGIYRQGKRLERKKKLKEVKKHKQEFFKILQELDEIYPFVKKDIEDITKIEDEELKKVISQYTDIKIGNLELMVMKGKLSNYESNTE